MERQRSSAVSFLKKKQKCRNAAFRAGVKARLSRAQQEARALRGTCEALEGFAITIAIFA